MRKSFTFQLPKERNRYWDRPGLELPALTQCLREVAVHTVLSVLSSFSASIHFTVRLLKN